MMPILLNLIKYRGLISALLIRGFKAKYKNSFLGIFWSFLNPLLNVAIFAFVFTAIIKINIKQYPLYLLCVIFPWNFFNAALINSIVSIVEDSHFVKNTAFPSEIIPFAVAVVNFVNFLIELAILCLVLLCVGKMTIVWLYIPFLILIEFILVSGIAVFLASAFVMFRDLNFILNFALRLFFYFLPVVYSLDFVPDTLRFFYLLNPLAVIIDSFAKVFFYGVSPDLGWLSLASLESAIIFMASFYFFNKMKKVIPERL